MNEDVSGRTDAAVPVLLDPTQRHPSGASNLATPQQKLDDGSSAAGPGRHAGTSNHESANKGEEFAKDTREQEDIEELSTPPAPVVYEVIRKHGNEEMERPFASLWWSGLAAGMSMSLSVVAQGALDNYLPDAEWTPLVSAFGYAVGFLIVMLGRQQLFTENTITAVLPVLAEPSAVKFRQLVRLWLIVLVANLVGTLLAALLFAWSPALPPDTVEAMLGIARKLMESDPSSMFFKAIVAGFLIAAMVWMFPTAESAKFWVIVAMTWVIAANELSHIVASSTEVLMMVFEGEASVADYFLRFMLPTLTGNIVGGTALFAVLSYAQVAKEI